MQTEADTIPSSLIHSTMRTLIATLGILFCVCFVRSSCDSNLNLSNSANCFSLEIYQKMALGKDNVISSPLSVDIVMAMMMAGAGGKTEAELRKALGFGDAPFSEIKEDFKTNLGQLMNGNGNNTVTIANSLWIRDGLKVQDAFNQTIMNDFYGQDQNLDFEKNATGATSTINNWVNDTTKGLISKLFDSPLDASTALVLVNAIYFKGMWAIPFNAAQPGDFANEDSSTKKDVPFMNKKDKYRYKFDASLNADLLEMDYEGGNISMQIILPQIGTKFSEFENGLTCSSFVSATQALSSMNLKEVNVTIPKFKADSDFDLNDPLMKSGIKEMFTPKANFSGIANGIMVSKVIQKAAITVNEEGSVAAAATGGVFTLTAVIDPPSFVANHTFMYIIRHKPTNMILFMGKVGKF